MLSLSGCSQLYNIRLLGELRDSEHLKKIDIDEEAPIPQSTSSYSREQKNAVKYQYNFFYEPPSEDAKIKSLIPGSEIPRWFNNQHKSNWAIYRV
ncbi:hypothetical protein JHK82_016526 [Glycine max]|nr:hypothetical protein JHK85_016945 [Glycine max]KAG5047167.1 hypothetical protein JHK86_016573 [Glycine max]KAG5149645.1 hypothetical protein JHK82_016526 [Glycine max]